jgi:nucleoside-diphosphate-sugar epimerase
MGRAGQVSRVGDYLTDATYLTDLTSSSTRLGGADHHMASYLVTGGAGFIGSHITQELVRRGHTVRVADSLITGKRENLAHVPGVEFLEGDLADAAFAARAVSGVEYVLHQAAIPSVPRSVHDPISTNRANVDATLHVLVAARDAGVKRVVYAGSSSAYGNAAALPKREDMPPSPLSPYALQKLVAEQYCQLFTQLYGLETVTTRYFNVFGPRQDPGSPYSGVISLFSTALLAGRQPTIHGDGEQTRDFTYVANVVDGVLRAAEANGVAGEVMNVATGGRISLNELLRVMNGILGTRIQAIHTDPRAGDVKDSQADISKAQRLLGYQPIVSFEDGLKQTLDWCRSETAPATATAPAQR